MQIPDHFSTLPAIAKEGIVGVMLASIVQFTGRFSRNSEKLLMPTKE